MRRLTGLAVFALVLATGAAAAHADGGPIDTSDGPAGVTAPGSSVRYLALIAPKGTVVAQVRRNGGEVLRDMPLRGGFAVPGVGLDGSSGGLSADGRTLVLAGRRASTPRRRSAFAILRADRLRLRRIVRLRGDFSYDALSPDGRRLYLIQYLSATDPTRYAVRLYDVRAGRLRPKPVVDPDEHAGEMRGEPLSRTYGPGGRWAYTLYDGNGKHPFVHALDTVAGRAKCVDTPMLADRGDLYDLTLRAAPGGASVTVTHGHRPLAVVDTRTFRVTKAARAGAPSGPAPDRGSGNGGWALAGLAGLLLAGAALVLRVRRRRRLATG
jgi:hypothetical protein